MSVRQQLTEPWGIVAAGLLGGLGAAVTAALASPPLGLLVGAAIAGMVYGVRVGLGALTDSDHRPSAPPRPHSDLPAPPRGSDAERWLRRAETAVDNLHRLTSSPRDPVLRAQIGDVDDQAVGVLGDLCRFAGQVTVVERSAAGIDRQRLTSEYQLLQSGMRGLPDGQLRTERERALRAVCDQLDVAGRLEQARETLLARMQSAVLGLEGLVARLAELLALHATADGGSTVTATRVSELTDDLEGMRAGLAEAEALSRAAISGSGGASRGDLAGGTSSGGGPGGASRGDVAGGALRGDGPGGTLRRDGAAGTLRSDGGADAVAGG